MANKVKEVPFYEDGRVYATVTVEITAEGKKRLTASAGYELFPMDARGVDLKEYGWDEDLILYPLVGDSRRRSYMVPVPKTKLKPLMATQWSEAQNNTRARRCRIPSADGKSTKICRDRSCYGCPNADKEHLITEPLSLDSLMEDSHWEPVGDDDTSRKAMAKIGAEEFFEYLKTTEPKYIEVYKLVLKHYTVADISEQTGLSKKSIYNYLERIEKLHDQFDAE